MSMPDSSAASRADGAGRPGPGAQPPAHPAGAQRPRKTDAPSAEGQASPSSSQPGAGSQPGGQPAPAPALSGDGEVRGERRAAAGAPPARTRDVLDGPVEALLASVGAAPERFETRIVADLVRTSLKLLSDGSDAGQLKLMNAALKEMRHAYRVFNRWRGVRKISIFGSARTPPDHRDYVAARAFSRAIAGSGWMAITGAGDGIMKAGHEGPRREASFGLSIRLPFETSANTVIEGDPKLINFRYFFTRKLMFLSHSDAVAVFPGGFGTHDELFEALTLIQTGKSNIVPVVLVEGAGGHYWRDWRAYVDAHLLGNGWISPEDPGLFHIAESVEDAVAHVLRFYRRYHSSRYVRERLVLRLTAPLPPEALAALNEEFSGLVASGAMEQSGALPEEDDHLDLPRLHFHHTRRHYGIVRALIDRINAVDDAAPGQPSSAPQ